jgi:hypothetical protein
MIFLFLNIDKVQKWLSLIGYGLNKLGGFFKFAHKKAVQLDLQGSINEYVKKVSKDIPTLETKKVRIEYVDRNIDRSSFISDNNIVLRLRRDDPNDLNFVHGAFLYVSTSLLFKVKRYISLSQRDSLDLYVTTKLIEKEKPNHVDYFLEEYLHPKLKDETSDRKTYYDQLANIDKGGLFYPVLLEELNCLGGKVFGRRQDDLIIIEVRELFNFLEKVSLRVIGQNDVNLEFQRNYCKSAIVIIGKISKIANEDKVPYLNYIRKTLYTRNIDTIYILGNIWNKEFINFICNDVADLYTIVRSRTTKSTIHFEDGSTKLVDTYIVLIQRVGSSVYISQ